MKPITRYQSLTSAQKKVVEVMAEITEKERCDFLRDVIYFVNTGKNPL